MKSFSWRRIVLFVVLFEFQGKAGFDSNCVSSEGDFVPQWIRVPAILSRRWKDCNLVCKRGEKLMGTTLRISASLLGTVVCSEMVHKNKEFRGVKLSPKKDSLGVALSVC